uniref:glutathione transferase n=2 Tax=Spongospora subterranea TaxID=70186 RepID=A0A0H5R483_9EUKA|eukprot:CRZ08948.1 hypothetical protein [Spongospora subterranea]
MLGQSRSGETSSKITLGYWNIRGLAEPIRTILHYTKTPFHDRRYECRGDGPEFDYSDWTDEKQKLGLDFPNLPYLIDDDVKITQSMAIMKYIAEKHDLCGRTPEERAVIDMVAFEIADCRSKYTGLCYNPRFDDFREAFVKETAPKVLKQFSTYIKKDFVAGEQISYADFLLYEMIQQYCTFGRHLVEPYENLVQFCKRFEAVPTIAAYMKSPDYQCGPFNNKIARFANNNS